MCVAVVCKMVKLFHYKDRSSIFLYLSEDKIPFVQNERDREIYLSSFTFLFARGLTVALLEG